MKKLVLNKNTVKTLKITTNIQTGATIDGPCISASIKPKSIGGSISGNSGPTTIGPTGSCSGITMIGCF
jgi:hypothetical protein